MGYRSEVKIVFYLTKGCSDTIEEANAKRGKTLPFSMLKLWFEENYPVKDAKEEWGATIDYGADHILLRYEGVKWYEGYEHPNNVSTAFEKFSEVFRSDERDHRGQYEFVRIGEEDDDIQLDGSSYSDRRLFVERSILFE